MEHQKERDCQGSGINASITDRTAIICMILNEVNIFNFNELTF